MRREMRPACKLILNRGPVDEVTRQLSLALFTDAALDLGKRVLDRRHERRHHRRDDVR